MTVTLLDDGADPPRVAYSVSRRVGPAVVRNRVRRRLRAAVSACDVRAPGVAAGSYLISVTPEAAALSYDELAGALEVALSKACS